MHSADFVHQRQRKEGTIWQTWPKCHHSEQLIMDFFATGVLHLCVCKLLLGMSIDSNLNGAADHKIQLETDIKITFDNEVFTASWHNISLLVHQI